MDEFIDKLIAFREEKKMLESKLKEAEAKYEKIKDVAYYNEEKYVKCDREKRSLERECKKLSTDYLRLRNEYNAIIAKYSTKNKEFSILSLENETLKEQILKLKEESKGKLYSHTARELKTIAVRELVEQLIIYAENEDIKVAREIKIALNTKMANGYIASDVLTKEWKQRLENLGRDRPRRNDIMTFKNQVGTVVAHADQVTLQYRKDE